MKKTSTIEVSWRDLENFLKEHNVYNSYMSEFVKYFKLSDIQTENWSKTWGNNPDCWLSFAFVWGETKEGHTFWSKLNEEWRALFVAEGADCHFDCDANTLAKDATTSYKAYTDQSLVGTWIKVHDFSYNRDVLPEWEMGVWEEDGYATEIRCEELGRDDVLVVEQPVVKTIRMKSVARDEYRNHKAVMVKVFVPKYNKLHWFFYRPVY